MLSSKIVQINIFQLRKKQQRKSTSFLIDKKMEWTKLLYDYGSAIHFVTAEEFYCSFC